MTDKLEEKDIKDLNNICEECQKEDESVTQNLILTGFKLFLLTIVNKFNLASFLSNFSFFTCKISKIKYS